jgi:hypothetical protein
LPKIPFPSVKIEIFKNCFCYKKLQKMRRKIEEDLDEEEGTFEDMVEDLELDF